MNITSISNKYFGYSHYLLTRIWAHISEKTASAGSYIEMYGFFMLIAYPLFYLIWHTTTPDAFETYQMRVFASVLNALLVVRKYWPTKLSTYFPLYWFSVLTFCHPFFFTYMTLENHFSHMWVINNIAGLFFLVILLDIKSLIGSLLVGVFSAVGYFYFFSTTPLYYEAGAITISGILAATSGAMFLGLIFSYNKEKINLAKMNVVSNLSTNIADRARGPLLTTMTQIKLLDNHLKKILEKVGLMNEYRYFYDIIHYTRDEIHQMILFVNNLLINSNDLALEEYELGYVSLNECIESCIAKYPLATQVQFSVAYTGAADTQIMGNFYLIVHVLQNLLNNALEAREGHASRDKVYIEISQNNKFVQMNIINHHVGNRIPKKQLANLFSCFNSTKETQSGLGLYFCKKIMSYHRGYIECLANKECTKFILYFPVSVTQEAPAMLESLRS